MSSQEQPPRASLRPHPYYRPKSQRHLLLPFMAPALIGMLGVMAGLSALGVPRSPWIAAPAVILMLVVALASAAGPPRDIPRLTWLWVLALIVGCGYLLEADERFAPLILVVAYLLRRWVNSRPLLPVTEVEPGRWQPVDAAPTQTDGPDEVTHLASPAAAYEQMTSARVRPERGPGRLPTPNPVLRPTGERRRKITLVPRKLSFQPVAAAIGIGLGGHLLVSSLRGGGGLAGVWARIAGLAFAGLIIAGAILVAVAYWQRAVHVIVDENGIRMTGRRGWRFEWSELAGVTLVPTSRPASGSDRLALAVIDPSTVMAHELRSDELPPFTHVDYLPRTGDPRAVGAGIAEALRIFVPDLYVDVDGPASYVETSDLGGYAAPPPANVLSTPNPRLRPGAQRSWRIRSSKRGLIVTLGAVSLASLAFGLFVLHGFIFLGQATPIFARIVGVLIGLMAFTIGAAGLVTVLFDLTRRIVIDGSGMRLTGFAGWRFAWAELVAVAVVVRPAQGQAPIAIAVAAPTHMLTSAMTYQSWDELPPFTHLCPVRGGRPADELRLEIAEALTTVVPDIYLGEVTR